MLVEKEKARMKVDPVEKRLDAVIRLLVEMNKEKEGEKFNEATAARILKSVSLTPTEIARILGKKSAQDVSQYLYLKKSGGRGDNDAKEAKDS